MTTVKMFTTTTCAPCKQMKAIMANIDHTGIHLEYLDARDETAAVIKYGIRNVPYFVMERDSEIIVKHSGTMSASEYIDWLSQAHCNYDGQPDEAQE